MKCSVKKLILTAAAALVLVAAVIMTVSIIGSKPKLVLKDRETGKIYAEYELKDGETFSVSFIHSVNQSEVVDYYRRGEDGKIICYANRFHSFGAGMPESWPEYAVVETTEDGILVSNLDIELDNMTYIVGTVSDHVLEIGGQKISLRDLCGRNAEVTFELK